MWLLPVLVAAGLSSSVEGILPPVLGIDLGNEWSKVSAIAPGYNLEMILNTQSKRKTRTVINYAGAVRTFGENAFAQQTMSPSTVLHHLPSSLGRHLNTTDEKYFNGFPSEYYPMILQKDKQRQSFEIGINQEGNKTQSVEDIVSHFVSHFQDLTKAHLKGVSWVEDGLDLEAAFVVPVGFSYRQRQLLKQAAQVAKIRAVAFVSEPMAGAVAHSLDLLPSSSKENTTESSSDVKEWHKIMMSVGSRNIQACAVHWYFTPTQGKTANGKATDTEMLTVDTLACANAHESKAARGAHQLDILIADAIIKQAEKSLKVKRADLKPRVFRRILKEAGKVKHTLSTNKDVSVFLEGLVADKDLSMVFTRAMFEDMVEGSGWLEGIKEIKGKLLPAVEGKNLSSIELLGGGWRAPRVLQEIESAFAPVPTGQKCNSDECPAMGATVLAANHSTVYKLKPLMVALKSEEDIAVGISYRGYEGEGEGLMEDASFSAGSRLGASKTRVLKTEHPVRVVSKSAQGKVLDVTIINGFDIIQKLKEKSDEKAEEQRARYNQQKDDVGHEWITTANKSDNQITVSLTIRLTPLGLIHVDKAFARWEEFIVEEKQELTTTTSTTTPATTTSTTTTSPAASTQPDAENSTSVASPSTSPAAAPVKTTFTETINMRSKALSVSAIDVGSVANELTDAEKNNLEYPLPMSSRQIRDARTSLKAFIKADREVEKLNEARNKLEAFIYELRAKLREDAEVIKVSTAERREKLLEELEADEEWLYDAGFTAKYSAVVKRMTEIQKRVADVMDKALTVRNRSQLIESSRAAITQMQDKMRGLLMQKSWIDAAAQRAFNETLERYDKWLTETIAAQKKLDDTVPSVLNETTVAAAWTKVTDAYVTLSKVRKPKTKAPAASSTTTTTAAPERKEEL